MKAINDALKSIQSKLKAPKDRNNSFGKYKYRNCEDILEAVKPLLSEYNCVLTIDDNVKEVCNIPVVEAVVVIKHVETNESITVKASAGIELNKKGMDVAQTFGASSSYARKYALNGLFLIDDSKDYDSDEHANQVNAGMQKEFNQALRDIKNAQDKSVLANAYKYFQGTQFEQQIQKECTAKSQAMGWNNK